MGEGSNATTNTSTLIEHGKCYEACVTSIKKKRLGWDCEIKFSLNPFNPSFKVWNIKSLMHEQSLRKSYLHSYRLLAASGRL